MTLDAKVIPRKKNPEAFRKSGDGTSCNIAVTTKNHPLFCRFFDLLTDLFIQQRSSPYGTPYRSDQIEYIPRNLSDKDPNHRIKGFVIYVRHQHCNEHEHQNSGAHKSNSPSLPHRRIIEVIISEKLFLISFFSFRYSSLCALSFYLRKRCSSALWLS